MRKLKLYFLILATPLVALSLVVSDCRADEWEKNTALYEDDAWYDVSEWLDGNDYNPTDETIGEWDDESYNWDTNDSDADDDLYGYGYDEYDATDDWYYDYDDNYYYHDYYSLDDDGIYDNSYHYYDYDNDGTYDAYSSYFDGDGDGIYDEFDYYRFSALDNGQDSTATNQNGSSVSDTAKQQASIRQQASSKHFQVMGQVQKTKKMQVRNGPERMVAQVSGDQGNNYIIDLGRADQFSHQDQEQDQQQGGEKLQVDEGDQITASGPIMKVGDKQVLLAQSIKIGNEQEHSINRSSRTINGKVAKTKSTKVRGHANQMVILDLDSGKQALVDLGKTDELGEKVAEGDQLKVTGIPVKVKDRSVILANSITKDGETTNIDRRDMRKKENSGS